MERSRKIRSVTRTAFTRLHNELKAELDSAELSCMLEVETKFQLLTVRFEELKGLDDEIFMYMVEAEATEEQLDAEIKTKEDYASRYFKVKFMIEKRSKECDNNSVISRQTENNLVKRKFKLPQIELKKFGGEIKEWLAWWGQFSKIDQDENIDSSDKFQYLIQSTIPNSRAREIVESYPPSTDNYPKAVEALKSRFGKEDMLIEVYIRELLTIVLQNTRTGSSGQLPSLYDKLESHLRSLESLGITTDKCEAMLFPLVESCIPEDLLRIWQRQSTVEGKPKDRLKGLMNFIKQEVEGEERISIAKSGIKFERNKVNKERKQLGFKTDEVPTAAGLLVTKQNKVSLANNCIFCSGNHVSSDCYSAQELSLEEKRKKATNKRCCFICLKPGHCAKNCRISLKCIICLRRHYPIMCPELPTNNDTLKVDKKLDASAKREQEETKSVEALHTRSLPSPEVYMQTILVRLIGKSSEKIVRAIIDTGSQRSYVLKEAAMKIGYEQRKKEKIVHSLFGGSKTEISEHNTYRICLGSLNDSYRCTLEVLDQEVICGNINRIQRGPWIQELEDENIELTDVGDDTVPIEVLIGADVAGKLFTGSCKKLKCGLVAIHTKLGWTVMGKVNKEQTRENCSMLVTSLFVKNISISDLWDLELIGIRDPVLQKTKDDVHKAVLKHFEETVAINDEGRYEVHMPWKEGHPPLPDNYEIALKRLDMNYKKLKKEGLMKEYQQVLEEWENEGVIEPVPQSELATFGHYLPHRHVVKENSTTKIRPVFDASAKMAGKPSLNECLEKGLNLIECIPKILLQFRLRSIGVIADIRRAFLQISLHKSDRDFLRFLWFKNEEKIQVYRHCRVVFGVTCSPFLLGAVINHLLLNKFRQIEDDVASASSSTIRKLMNGFYVDNCVTSVDNITELGTFMKEASDIMKERKFDLRGWEHTLYNSGSEGNHTTNVLGLSWDREEDSLEISSEGLQFDSSKPVTKRTMLSMLNRVYDPIGFTCPVSLCPKLLLQSTWKKKEGWDTEVSEEIKKVFLKWVSELIFLANIKVPRWIGVSEGTKLSLHTFCDASQSAYAAVVYMRCVTVNRVSVQLVQAKTRISPTKKMTIPRLELLAATIGARLHNSVMESLGMKDVEAFLWSDSSTVLSWIRREEQWLTFVGNRVTEIKKLTSVDQWRHVPGEINPADLPSRGCGAKQLWESQWWEGPHWLKGPPELWPEASDEADETEIVKEKRKCVKSLLIAMGKPVQDWLYRCFSSFPKILRLVGWMWRFAYNCRHPNARKLGELTLEELKYAETYVIKTVQQESFIGIKDEKLSSLCPLEDEDGILRIRTKVTEREDLRDFRYPMILPAKHPVVILLIQDQHNKHSHVGVQGLLSLLRERYWILGGRKSIKTAISKCIVCQRYSTQKVETMPASLPIHRVRDAAPFEVVGVDFAGPLYLRNKDKAWICLYTCAVYRAVHLELVSGLSTDKFIQTLRRFIARRGRPSVIFSDNGTNFVGTDHAFKKVDFNKIEYFGVGQRIQWKFNPPSAAWWGGWWERLIRILKETLRKILGRAKLDYEEMSTILCDCEALMNSRPLTYLSNDSKDLVALTPSMFLQEIKEVGVPDIDQIDSSHINARISYRQNLREAVRERFRREYLGQLHLKSTRKKNSQIKVGEIVLVGSDNMKRLEWPLAKVEELIPGRDGEVRVVRLKTSTGMLLRPVQRLYPLEGVVGEASDACERLLRSARAKTRRM